MTSSPGSRMAWKRLKRACLPPTVTMVSSGVTSRPFSRRNFSAKASRSSGMPAGGAYLVLPWARARLAASLTCSGVSKSGSPAVRATRSTPFRLSSRARALTATVAEGFMDFTLWERPRMA
jgi:hypothetical protein